MNSEVLENAVVKSINDNREYRVVELPNKLKCLLIHDKEADKSSASLSVKVGYHQDPVERPGLAHFLEHMLFLGTEKYPAQDEYANYISSNSGLRNAYTSSTETNYYFDCANSAVEGALDRFSQFFICPLFTESCTQREINAVNSEHEKNILQDAWRQWQLLRSTSKEGHVYNRFGTGSLATLNQPSIRDDLLEFHKRYYSANLMKAVIYGKENLDVLEEWAKKYFGPIQNSEKETQKVNELPFGQENLGSFWKVFPINDKDLLEFVWILEDLEPHYKNNPIKYLSHLLGHEGQNSLLSYLMDEGLAIGLVASHMPEREMFTIFSIEIELTKKGLQNYKQVCSAVFAYLKIIREKGPQKRIFNELNKILKFQFDFKDKERPIGYVTSLVSRMHYYPIEDVLRVGYLMEDYQPDLIQKTMNSLTMDNLRICLTSKSVENECNLSEKWYGTKYTFDPFDSEFKKTLESFELKPTTKSGKILDLPPVNKFIPENFDLVTTDFESLPNYPEKIYESNAMETYFKQDNKFKKPKACVTVKLYCNDLGYGHDLKTSALWGLWLKLFKEALREVLYDAQVARLHVDVDKDSLLNGMRIFITGFHDSIDKICIDLFENLKKFDPSTMRQEFANFRQDVLEDLKNITKKPPYQQIINLLGTFLNSNHGAIAVPEVLHEIVTEIDFDDILKFHKNFFKTIRFESLFVGNLTKEKAVQTSKDIETILCSMRSELKALPKALVPENRPIKLDNSSIWFYEHQTPTTEEKLKESNSCLACYYQYEKQEHDSYVLMEILSNYLKSPCFNTLRTDEQLGYIVHSSSYNYRNVLGFIILIQSNVRSSHFISQRISAFLDKMREKIINISDEEFNKYVESVRVAISQKDLSILEEGNRFWNEINTHQFVFDRKEINLEKLNTVKKEQLIDLFEQIFYKNRKQLELHLGSQDHMEENIRIKAERLNSEKSLQAVQAPDDLHKKVVLYPDFYLPHLNKTD